MRCEDVPKLNHEGNAIADSTASVVYMETGD